MKLLKQKRSLLEEYVFGQLENEPELLEQLRTMKLKKIADEIYDKCYQYFEEELQKIEKK
jgi:hypothetical protein